MDAPYFRLWLDVDQGVADKVTELFENCGALSVTVTSANGQEIYDEAFPSEPQWHFQTLTGIFDAEVVVSDVLAKVDECLGSPQEVHCCDLHEKDWETKWQQGIKPIKVGTNLWVCPSWCTPVEQDAVNLIIDPGLAFGTGSHETTKLCLDYLSKENLKGKQVMDFGCGSGILGIAACKLGAQSVVGVDIDQHAVNTTRHNIQVNGVQQNMSVYTNSEFNQLRPRKFDLVVANILANTLIELKDFLSALLRQGGTLLMSGILVKQVGMVKQIYDLDLEFEELQNKDWVLLVGKNKIH